LKKISIRSLFILLKKAQAMVQKTSRQNVTSTVLILSSLLSFLMDVMGGKITINLKHNCTQTETEETHANRKRARSAPSRERLFKL
jgi:hypothetical protein